MYYSEAIKNETAFQAAKAENYESWIEHKSAVSSQMIYVGEKINRQYVSMS